MEIKTINPNFFLVRINKQEQVNKKVGKDTIKLAETFTFGKAGMQMGEIVKIGVLAKLIMPMAKIGGILHFSWKVEYTAEDAVKPNMALVHEDKDYNYYTVTISEYKGRDCETYAYSDDTGIYTHPSFIVLKKDEILRETTTSSGGILLFKSYKMSDDEIKQKIEQNKQQIYSLSITYQSQLQTRESNARQTKDFMAALEKENYLLTQELQGKEKFDLYTVKYCSPLHNVNVSDKVYAHNILFMQPLTVKDEELLIGKFKHVGAK